MHHGGHHRRWWKQERNKNVATQYDFDVIHHLWDRHNHLDKYNALQFIRYIMVYVKEQSVNVDE